jgi:hypothetical protein
VIDCALRQRRMPKMMANHFKPQDVKGVLNVFKIAPRHTLPVN